MKTFTAALAILFVAVLCCQVSSSPISVDHYGPCCLKFITRPLPMDLVKSYRHIGGHGSPSAVLFTTVKDKLVCARVNDEWVQDMVNQLKDKKLSG